MNYVRFPSHNVGERGSAGIDAPVWQVYRLQGVVHYCQYASS